VRRTFRRSLGRELLGPTIVLMCSVAAIADDLEFDPSRHRASPKRTASGSQKPSAWPGPSAIGSLENIPMSKKNNGPRES
jgi:hypothetical protein